ncbi:ADP-glyceromanno-heptose 6-epimerase [Brumimicrobium aurantiacum]|uniref:ADP-L-glycero-D-manno-heptose-6-epimerase n=1 Tax=Brumimicrobium aurantiacum TaxID=1737063 RepID=A0A3E1EYW0_9FLAO|nr:ADP-glyceromanno-heptose 6-epimerase [Brumimicrobium aurantiacum]RFC54647.1 ADP-glyceromanno-heptose 6-epimerase [Brumimicrobium aurantiacum]
MIVVTGAAGFIGSGLVSKLNDIGISRIIIVDDFSNNEKEHNLVGKKYSERIDRGEFLPWLKEHGEDVKFIFHIGARTDTTEFDKTVFDELNLNYSKELWRHATQYSIPLVYASSAATYGLGEFGYDDDHELVEKLKPLNPYGDSKQEFDKWVLEQPIKPPFWAGLKFFNVYGPNEYHKGRMASVVLHAFRQIMKTGEMKLFRSHNEKYEDGEQKRDFIYVKDVLNICVFLMEKRPESGLYNVGSGKARTFKTLASNTFHAMNRDTEISYIDTPADIRDKYQYYTEAKINKLISAGYTKGFHTLEQGINDYVENYLIDKKYL